jgi:hypothetical protein
VEAIALQQMRGCRYAQTRVRDRWGMNAADNCRSALLLYTALKRGRRAWQCRLGRRARLYVKGTSHDDGGEHERESEWVRERGVRCSNGVLE